MKASESTTLKPKQGQPKPIDKQTEMRSWRNGSEASSCIALPKNFGSRLDVTITPAPSDLATSSRVHEHLHSYMYIPTHRHTHTDQIKKYIFFKNTYITCSTVERINQLCYRQTFTENENEWTMDDKY